ncbi:MAG: gamma-glutamyl-phosphate reductase, partial [Desulfobacterales bacterium]|nr:gamma-glutamyl-phosphate reductase [Desulfobacterales bacterium]
MSLENQIIEIAKQARASARIMAALPAEQKNKALFAIARRLEKNKDLIQAENEKDVAAARENGLSDAMIDRLTITDKILNGMVEGL